MSTDWNLFLDDERHMNDVNWIPYHDLEKYYQGTWETARNLKEVKQLIKRHDCLPVFVSFDHDLGVTETGLDVAKYLISLDLDSDYTFSDDFDFVVHSKNPIGAGNILNLLNHYLVVRKL